MAVIKKDGNFMGLPMNVARGNPIPLDKSEIWYSYESMVTYAATDPIAYVGQILGLVDETNSTATAYIILNTAGDLQEIGASIDIPELKGDNASITIDSNTIALKNWGVQYYKYIEASGIKGEENYVEAHYELQIVDADNPWIAGLEPKVTSENNQMVLAWYQPNPTTIEGLGSQLSSLQTSVSDLQTSMGNVYTKKETDDKIAEKVAAAAHLKRKIIDSVDDINKNADDADQYIYMVPAATTEEHDQYDEYMVIVIVDEEGVETRFVEKVGSWEVDLEDYVTDTDLIEALKEKVDVQDGFSLIPVGDLEKLSGIEAGAQKNFITSVDNNNFTVEGGKLLLNTILVSQVTNLQNLLDNKVNKEEGKGLSSNDLTDELLASFNKNIVDVQGLSTSVSNLVELLGTSTTDEGEYVSSVLEGIHTDINNLNILLQQHNTTIELHTTQIGDLNTLSQKNKTDIGTINTTIQGIQNTINSLSDTYVTKSIFQATVGNIEELQASASTLHTQVKELQAALTWGELTI